MGLGNRFELNFLANSLFLMFGSNHKNSGEFSSQIPRQNLVNELAYISGSNALVYMMLASLGSLRRLTLRNSENINVKGAIEFLDFVTRRKWHPAVGALFRMGRSVGGDCGLEGSGKLVISRISEGTQRLRDSPLWDTDEEDD